MDYIWQDKKRTIFGLPLSFTKYSLTEDCLFIETGFLSKREDEVRLYRIMDISLTVTVGQRMFGVGTITCDSADKTMGNFEIKNIKTPREIKEKISRLVEEQRTAKRVSSREYMHESDMDDDDNDEHSML